MTVTACGTSPTQAPKDVKARATTPQQPPAQAPAPPPEDNQKVAREHAQRAIAAFGALKSLQATVHTIDVDPVDGDAYKGILDVYFQAPGKFRIAVQPGSRLNVGTRMVFTDGDDHISVRPGGMLGFAKVKLGVQDARVKTSRGFQIMKITKKSVMARLSDPRAVVGYMGETKLDGRAMTVLSVTGPILLEGTTEERVYIDRLTSLPIRGELRAGRQIVFSTTLATHSVNAPAPEGAFDL
jgi:hypothetical protein